MANKIAPHIGYSLLVVSIVGCSSFNQTVDQVAVRKPGYRTLDDPIDNKKLAAYHWQYAWLADAAYNDVVNQQDKNECKATSAYKVLTTHGWRKWDDFPTPNGRLYKKMIDSHLRAEVWENREKKKIVVAFGGTDLKSVKDWKANLRWLTFKVDDEYTQLVRDFAPAFQLEYLSRAQTDQQRWLQNATLISTGHSLGGGLAQQFAYALPLNPQRLRVTQVFAFNPSPVTGFYSVNNKTREENRKGLKIERIYERGEILAILRSFTSLLVKPSEKDPTIKGVRYNFLISGNWFKNHSMHNFACAISKAAGVKLSNLP